MDLLYMEHPGIEGKARTTQEAFDVVWKEKGWVLVEESVEDTEVPASAVPSPAVEVADDVFDPMGTVTNG